MVKFTLTVEVDVVKLLSGIAGNALVLLSLYNQIVL